jgi:lysophospholipase L1-like esterase
VSQRWLKLLIAGLLGAILGRGLAHTMGAVWVTPSAVDTNLWQIISPGLQAGALHPGRGSHIVDGAMVITDHLFFRGDRLVPKVQGVPAQVRMSLAPSSGTVEVLLGQPPAGMVRLSPARHGTQVSVAIVEGKINVQTASGTQVLGGVLPGRLELSAIDGSARIERISVLDASGEVLMSQDYSGYALPTYVLNLGTLLGGCLGLVLLMLGSGRSVPRATVGTVLLSAPVIGVLAVRQDAWLPLLERLYLVNWSPAELARVALGLSLLPLLTAVISRLVGPAWHRLGVAPRGLIALWSLLAVLALAVRGSPSVWMIGAGLWLVLPWWLVRKDGRAGRPWLALDLVALGLVLSLGWPLGMLLGTLWRMAVLTGGASVLARRAPRPAMDSLFVLVICLLPATETAVRGGPLGTTWDPTQLSEERPSERGWRDPLSSWTGQCGLQDEPKRLLVAGGSSTGGAYQFGDDPEASFVAQAHARLCEERSSTLGLITSNYGRGNRDSFTIARTIQTMLERAEPDVVALYLGVNDLLASQYPMTRKQREAIRQSRSAAIRGAAGLAKRLHLVTGLWLATRDLPDPEAPSVPDVPLPDAVENFEQISDLVEAHGATLILMTEHTRAEQAGRLQVYRQAQQDLAESRPGVIFLDVRPAFEDGTDDEMLVDQNHLTRRGGAQLGALIAQTVGPLLR